MQNGQFGLKMKYAKNMRKRLYKHIQVVLCKKRLEKQLIFENESILKMAKNGHNAKAIAHAKWAVWLKN